MTEQRLNISDIHTVIRLRDNNSPRQQLPLCQTVQGEPDRNIKLRLVRQGYAIRGDPVLVTDC